MVILIDGYNVLKGMHLSSYVTHEEICRFIREIAFFVCQRRHSAIIVFDGNVSLWSEETDLKGIQIIFTGPYTSADSWIEDYLNENSQQLEFVLISSDRQLSMHVAKLRIPAMHSSDFVKLLHKYRQYVAQNLSKITKSIDPQLPIIKTTGFKNIDLDDLMINVVGKSKVQIKDENNDSILFLQKVKPVCPVDKRVLHRLSKL